MIEPVTLGAYMAATGPASPAVASLMAQVVPPSEPSPVMPMPFPRLARAIRPECAPRGGPAHSPLGQRFGPLPPDSENLSPYDFATGPRGRRARGSPTPPRGATSPGARSVDGREGPASAGV